MINNYRVVYSILGIQVICKNKQKKEAAFSLLVVPPLAYVYPHFIQPDPYFKPLIKED